MRIFRGTIAVLAGAVCALWLTAASAADLTGEYVGAESADLTLTLTQDGTALTGTFAGSRTGTLTGTTDGDVTATGTITMVGYGKVTFTATLEADGLHIVAMVNGEGEEAVFVPAGAAPTGGGEAIWYTNVAGTQAGPFTLAELVAQIGDGRLEPTDYVWHEGIVGWAQASTYAELAEALAGGSDPQPAPPAGQYYVQEDGEIIGPMDRADVVARIRSGLTGPGDYVLLTGRVGWAPIETFPELAAELETPAPPEPVPPPVPEPPAPEPTPEPPAPPATMTDADVNAALVELLESLTAEEYPDLEPAARGQLITCMMDTVQALSTENRQALLEAGFVPDDALIVRFEAEAPGITEEVEACGASVLAPARTSVGIDGLGQITVVGGNNQSAEPIEGGYRFVIDGLEITVVPGLLTVGGATAELPPTFGELVVTMEDETTVVTLDGEELELH